jgi:glutamate-1-semialdehyde 2,1-aminomutase/spore coat polysaccharide biosynthesis protein SpsF
VVLAARLAAEPPTPPQARTLDRTRELLARARAVIPSATQTFSKGPTQYVEGVAPAFLARGSGCRVWDVDGNEYIDLLMGLGPLILGHSFAPVNEAVTTQLTEGTLFTLPHPLEVELSELLVGLIPCAEMVRFGKNGSDVTAGAVRVARAFTGRDVIAASGYHGWQDWYIGTTTRDAGVPAAVRDLTVPFQYNDLGSLEQVFADHPGMVAAVIMEPVSVEEPRDGYLEAVRAMTEREGAVLIFDEVLTGFRLALGGAQEHYRVTPDLACFGKAMANGYPLAAVVGRRDIMELFDEVFFSFTFGGETLSLAAARETIIQIHERDVIRHVRERGQELQDGYNALAALFEVEQLTECVGMPSRSVITFRDQAGEESLALKGLFQQECLKRGVLFAGGHNPSLSHTAADVEQTLRVYRAAFEVLRDAVRADDVDARIEGEPLLPVFKVR